MVFLILLSCCSSLLGACTIQTGATDENGLRPHLNVDLQVPARLLLSEESKFSIVVEQRNQPVDAEQAIFQIWPEGREDELIAIDGVKEQNGLYTASYRLTEEGIYIVRCLVEAGSLEAMPAKRFAIGANAVLHLTAMEAQRGETDSSHQSGGHHNH